MLARKFRINPISFEGRVTDLYLVEATIDESESLWLPASEEPKTRTGAEAEMKKIIKDKEKAERKAAKLAAMPP